MPDRDRDRKNTCSKIARQLLSGLDEVSRLLRDAVERTGQMCADLQGHHGRVDDAQICGVVDLQLSVDDTCATRIN